MSTHHYKIRVPIWSRRAVGINSALVCDDNYISIEWKNKEGKLDYPHTYYIDGRRAKEYPLEPANGDTNIMLFVIPINELTIIEKKDDVVGKIILFSGEEIEITHKQFKKIEKLIDDKSSDRLNVNDDRIIKKTAIADVIDTGDENPDNIDRSPEAVAERQAKFRKKLERQSKEVAG